MRLLMPKNGTTNSSCTLTQRSLKQPQTLKNVGGATETLSWPPVTQVELPRELTWYSPWRAPCRLPAGACLHTEPTWPPPPQARGPLTAVEKTKRHRWARWFSPDGKGNWMSRVEKEPFERVQTRANTKESETATLTQEENKDQVMEHEIRSIFQHEIRQ